ncbi:Uncharacterised protein [Prevotella nigrescens]|nr:Uncharacterised protein [Prevotella nigrescens]
MAFFLKNLVCMSPHLCFCPVYCLLDNSQPIVNLENFIIRILCEKYFVSYMGSIKNNKYFLFYLLILLPLQRYKGIL